jgi:hypothetical protein
MDQNWPMIAVDATREVNLIVLALFAKPYENTFLFSLLG